MGRGVAETEVGNGERGGWGGGGDGRQFREERRRDKARREGAGPRLSLGIHELNTSAVKERGKAG